MTTPRPTAPEGAQRMPTEPELERSGPDLAPAIQQRARDVSGTRVIGLPQVHDLADRKGPFHSTAERSRAIRAVEIAALEMGVVPTRYLPNLGTIGAAGQIQLLRSRVAIVGLGGLGGYVAEALARMGVGALVLIDGDLFEETNLNRQLLCTERQLGIDKVRAACSRVGAVNAAVEAIGHTQVVTRENLPTLLRGADVLVDAVDRLPTRLVLQDGAQALGIPMVHGGIAGFLGQATTVFPDDLGLRALYGDGDQLPEQGLEAVLGTPAATPMAVAAWEAQEVVKILTGRGAPLRQRLLVIDMESGTVQTVQLG